MRSQYLKDLYYVSFGKLSVVSLLRHRLFPSRGHRDAFVNIGCGPKYVEGMVNIDGNVFRRKDIWLDATLGMPFPNRSIRGIYASHMVEHFNTRNVRQLFAEFHRVLKPGGALRLVVPSLEYAIGAYTADQPSRLPDWPELYRSKGGRFNNFMLCANQHFLMFDLTFMQELLTDAGFERVTRKKARISSTFPPESMVFEPENDPEDSSLYVEAIKRPEESPGP